MTKTMTVLFLLPLLASCAALDIDEARLGGSLLDITATDEGTIGTQAVKSEADGDARGVQVELTNRIDSDTSAGLLFGYSTGSIQQVDIEQFDVAAVGRQYLVSDRNTLRPFIEGRAGYTRFEARDEFLGSGEADAFKVGAGIGLEMQLDAGLSVFVQGNYDAAFAQQFDTQGPSLVIGGAIRF